MIGQIFVKVPKICRKRVHGSAILVTISDGLKLMTPAVTGLSEAVVAIGKGKAILHFPISAELSLIPDPLAFILRNSDISYRFPDFDCLNTLWSRIREAELLARLFS